MVDPKTILCVGDIHCGSHHGLWPESEIPTGSRKYKGCRYLMECWRHFIADLNSIVPGKVDLSVLMGDLVDGKQRKSAGVGLFSTSMGDQAEAACEVLQPIRDKSNDVWRVWGTPYHEEFENCLNLVDSTLDVSVCQQVIDAEIGGSVFNFAHHPDGGTALYMGTKVDKMALWSQLAAASNKIPVANILVRAHVHEFMAQETTQRMVVQNGCWELPTAHAKKQNYHRFQPTLGATLLVKDDHPLSMHGWKAYLFRYDVPMPEVIPYGKAKTKTQAAKSKRTVRRSR